MARQQFRPTPGVGATWYRFDTASGSDTPVTLTTESGLQVPELRADASTGALPAFYGPDGVGALYPKRLTGPGGTVVSTGAAITGFDPTPAPPEEDLDKATYTSRDQEAFNADAAAAVARVQRALVGAAGGLYALLSGTTYSLLRGIGSGRFTKYDLPVVTTGLGGYSLNQLQSCAVVAPMLSTASGSTTSGVWSSASNVAAYGGRAVTDAVTTNASATLTSATAAFTSLDVGKTVTGTGIQSNTTISSVTNATTVVLSKTATATATGVALSILGPYAYSVEAGATRTRTTPAGTTKIGIRGPKAANGGLMKVSINGDATLANLLPTAQQMIDRGSYTSAILVANGGSLNPTDRVYDTDLPGAAATQWDVLTAVAEGMTPGAHTVVLTATGYAQAGTMTGGRAYWAGFADATDATLPTDAGTEFFALAVANNALASAWEYAMRATDYPAEFLGNIHGSEVQDSFAAAKDRAALTLVSGTPVAANGYIEFTRTSHIVHPTSGVTLVDIVTKYRLDRNGLSVTPDMTFAVTQSYDACYSMMPMGGSTLTTTEAFNRAGLLAYGSVLAFTGGADTTVGQSRSAAAWLWGTTSKVAALIYLPDLYGMVDGWDTNSADRAAAVQDRSGTITKVYINWLDLSTAPHVIAAGTRKKWTTRYLIGYFPAGADATLASL